MTDYITVPAIVLICWFVGYCIKTFGNSEKIERLIPCIVGIFGAILGVTIYHFNPDLIPANDIFTAICIGITSGMASTGVHQIYKQITKGNTTK